MVSTLIWVVSARLDSGIASTIFSSMAGFSILRENLHRLAWQATDMIEGKVSLDRINDFIQNAELLDAFVKPTDPKMRTHLAVVDQPHQDKEKIGFRNATFAWSVNDDDGALTPSSRKYRLHIDEELLFKRGCINLIIGPT